MWKYLSLFLRLFKKGVFNNVSRTDGISQLEFWFFFCSYCVFVNVYERERRRSECRGNDIYSTLVSLYLIGMWWIMSNEFPRKVNFQVYGQKYNFKLDWDFESWYRRVYVFLNLRSCPLKSCFSYLKSIKYNCTSLVLFFIFLILLVGFPSLSRLD